MVGWERRMQMLNLLNDSAVLQVILHFALKLLKKPTEKWWTGEKRWSFLQKCPYQRRPKTLFSGKNPLSALVFLCNIIAGCAWVCVLSVMVIRCKKLHFKPTQRFRLFRFLSRKNLWFGGERTTLPHLLLHLWKLEIWVKPCKDSNTTTAKEKKKRSQVLCKVKNEPNKCELAWNGGRASSRLSVFWFCKQQNGF